MTDKQKIRALRATLKIVLNDAKMALDGSWDKSDIGFECQVELIKTTLNMTKKWQQKK